VQLLTLAEDHVSVVVPPGATPGGFALRDTDGDVAEVTFTVTLDTAPPPGPLQVSVNVVLAEIAPDWALPFTARLPLQPLDAVHASALLVVHDSVVVPPEETEVGLADKLIVGGLCPPVPCPEVPPEPPPPPHAAIDRDANNTTRGRIGDVLNDFGMTVNIGRIRPS
jgi:hypothetical protein